MLEKDSILNLQTDSLTNIIVKELESRNIKTLIKEKEEYFTLLGKKENQKQYFLIYIQKNNFEVKLKDIEIALKEAIAEVDETKTEFLELTFFIDKFAKESKDRIVIYKG